MYYKSLSAIFILGFTKQENMDQNSLLLKQLLDLSCDNTHPLYIPIFDDSVQGVSYNDFKNRFLSVTTTLGLNSTKQLKAMLSLYLKDYPLVVFQNNIAKYEDVGDIFLFMDTIFAPVLEDDLYVKQVLRVTDLHQDIGESISSFLARIMTHFGELNNQEQSIWVHQALKYGLRADLLEPYLLKYGQAKQIETNQVYQYLRYEETIAEYFLDSNPRGHSTVSLSSGPTGPAQVQSQKKRKRRRRRRRNPQNRVPVGNLCVDIQESLIELQVATPFHVSEQSQVVESVETEVCGQLESCSVVGEVVRLAPTPLNTQVESPDCELQNSFFNKAPARENPLDVVGTSNRSAMEDEGYESG